MSLHNHSRNFRKIPSERISGKITSLKRIKSFFSEKFNLLKNNKFNKGNSTINSFMFIITTELCHQSVTLYLLKWMEYEKKKRSYSPSSSYIPDMKSNPYTA